jgi:hypothetical protein
MVTLMAAGRVDFRKLRLDAFGSWDILTSLVENFL